MACNIIVYVKQDLNNHEVRGFYSAEDADSYLHEGAKNRFVSF